MELKGNLFQNFAICKASVNKNNSITIGKANRAGTDLDLGEEVRVRLIKLDTDNFVRPRDVTSYTTTIQKTGQIHIPNDAMSDLKLEAGEVIGYVAVSTSKIPGKDNGPIRDKVGGDTPVDKRTRDSNMETFEGPMAVTGQITVPQEVRDPLNIKQGDPVTVTINGDETRTLKIGTGNRVTIPAEVREDMDLEKGDRVEMKVTVF